MAHLFLIFFFTFTLINSEKFTEENCKYQSESELKLLFQQEIEKYFYMISIGLNHNPEMEFIFSNSILNFDNVNQTNEKCSIIDNYELCPRTQVDLTRKDRYPFRVSYSVCNCEECLYFNGRCVPLSITKPILYRTVCNSDNYWQWKYGFEKIPIDCVCLK